MDFEYLSYLNKNQMQYPQWKATAEAKIESDMLNGFRPLFAVQISLKLGMLTTNIGSPMYIKGT